MAAPLYGRKDTLLTLAPAGMFRVHHAGPPLRGQAVTLAGAGTGAARMACIGFQSLT
jgi:hypothetical protein